MKATGIVRRIDDLGRVVIPKEIRRTLRIRVGDPLEIYTDREGEVILKKYSLMGDMGIFAQQYADSLAQTTGYQVVVTDREQVIAASAGARKELMDKAMEMAGQIAGNAPIAVQACKRAISTRVDRFIDVDLATEEELFSFCFNTEDQKMAMRAFLEKKPRGSFKGE